MELINWSLHAIDTLFSTRRSASGEPHCPTGTNIAGYTTDAWAKWRVLCLAPLSMEDIEDIYLFATLITGILLMGLGFGLGYRKMKKMTTAVQRLTEQPLMTGNDGRALTGTMNSNMDNIIKKLTACEKRMENLETKMDNEQTYS